MPTLLQINVTANWGSTGRIAEQIGTLAVTNGWTSYIAYGRHKNPSSSKLIKIGHRCNVYSHYVGSKVFDREGLGSIRATYMFIEEIKKVAPDIIHLHNIHDHYINYPILFDFLASYNKPVVWTQHDCWAFTGGCFHYSKEKCYKWENGCHNCQRKGITLFDKSKFHYQLRCRLFNSVGNLTLVPVSMWLKHEIEKSFLGKKRISLIYNGVDTNQFSPVTNSSIRKKYGFGNRYVLLGVASVWTANKGLQDYIELSKIIDESRVIVLVGVSKSVMRCLPSNIITIPRTQNTNELVELYNVAEVVLNLSYEETFGLTTAEGMACGTPGVVYDCTASPELITLQTGRVVKAGDIMGLNDAINELLMMGKEKTSVFCRDRACSFFDKNKSFEQYISLYRELLSPEA